MTPAPQLDAVKMLSQLRTVILLLCVIFIGASPTWVYSFVIDSSQHIMGGLVRQELDRAKRESKLSMNEEVASAKALGEDILMHLAQFESVLHERRLVAEEGSPSQIATVCSWADVKALSIARKSHLNAKASYLLSYQLCMKDGKQAGYCGTLLTKRFSTPKVTEHCPKLQYRTFNGSCNNQLHPTWGAAFSAYSRLLPPTYKDGIWEPKDRGMVAKFGNTIEISEKVQKSNGRQLTDVTLATASWGGLVAYDMAHTVSSRMYSTGDQILCCEDIRWKLAPRHLHPLCMPITDKKETKCYNYVRSMLAPTEEYRFGPAQQMNAASHLLDGSCIYGSSEEVSKTLRTGMKGKILDVNPKGGKLLSLFDPIFDKSDKSYLFTGDVRLNTDVISAVMYVVLTKEHNRLAEGLSAVNPHWDDERLFQEARRILIAELQHITYNEWLPVLIGEKEIVKYGLMLPKSGFARVYNSGVRPSVANSFANAAMRFVVSLLDEQLLLLNEDRTPIGNISFQFSLIEPKLMADEEQLASLVRGLSTQNCQSNDLNFPEAVTKYLYSKPNGTGYDVLSMDIQRGRDHGLPSYVAFRRLYGFPSAQFDDLLSSIPSDVVSKLKRAYEKLGSIDLIVGGLAETPRRDSLLGPVFTNIIAQQMVATRVGDRYFYDNPDQTYPFSKEQLKEIQQVKLARILCDNTSVKRMQPHVFRKPGTLGNGLMNCSDDRLIKRLNLNLWIEDPSS